MTSLRTIVRTLAEDLKGLRRRTELKLGMLETGHEILAANFYSFQESVTDWMSQPEEAPTRRPKLTAADAKAFMEEQQLPSLHPTVPGDKVTVFEQKKCQHCNGVHDRKCPAVAEIEYHADGKVKRVAYFPHGSWPTDGVIWLEDVMEALDQEEETDGESEG